MLCMLVHHHRRFDVCLSQRLLASALCGKARTQRVLDVCVCVCLRRRQLRKTAKSFIGGLSDSGPAACAQLEGVLRLRALVCSLSNTSFGVKVIHCGSRKGRGSARGPLDSAAWVQACGWMWLLLWSCARSFRHGSPRPILAYMVGSFSCQDWASSYMARHCRRPSVRVCMRAAPRQIYGMQRSRNIRRSNVMRPNSHGTRRAPLRLPGCAHRVYTHSLSRCQGYRPRG